MSVQWIDALLGFCYGSFMLLSLVTFVQICNKNFVRQELFWLKKSMLFNTDCNQCLQNSTPARAKLKFLQNCEYRDCVSSGYCWSRSMLFDTGPNKLTSFTSSPASWAHVGFLTKLQKNGALVMQVNIIYW